MLCVFYVFYVIACFIIVLSIIVFVLRCSAYAFCLPLMRIASVLHDLYFVCRLLASYMFACYIAFMCLYTSVCLFPLCVSYVCVCFLYVCSCACCMHYVDFVLVCICLFLWFAHYCCLLLCLPVVGLLCFAYYVCPLFRMIVV